jgi:hypothetical protein
MAVHRKAVALMEPMEAMARLAARAQSRAEAAQTRASGSASWDNADGTRTVIGPQAGSATMATHVGDVTPPPVPTGIRAWSGDGSLHVLWAGSLAGDVPADFDHVTVLVDGRPVAEMRSAGSVTVGGLKVGSTVSVTATAEDDACLADGTPAHNASAACPAVTVAIRDAVAEVRADADAHGEQIEAVRRDIAGYKATAEATYATKTEVDERTGAITKTLAADYLSKTDAAAAYAERTELTEAVNQLSSTMTSNYSAFTDYRQSNDAALSRAQSDATNAQGTIDAYKQSNDRAVADAKAAGTTAQDQLKSYKGSNDAAVQAAKKAGTDAQSQLGSYRAATDQRLDELKNVADNAIESWYLRGAPTAGNPPASSWTTDALRRQHAGDLYMDTETGYSYRWSGTAWVQVKDSDVDQGARGDSGHQDRLRDQERAQGHRHRALGQGGRTPSPPPRSYTDGSVAREATARDAAIRASADGISLDVSKTYTRSDAFSAYQSDADSRIATANSNASTASATARRRRATRPRPRPTRSSAVSTANSAVDQRGQCRQDRECRIRQRGQRGAGRQDRCERRQRRQVDGGRGQLHGRHGQGHGGRGAVDRRGRVVAHPARAGRERAGGRRRGHVDPHGHGVARGRAADGAGGGHDGARRVVRGRLPRGHGMDAHVRGRAPPWSAGWRRDGTGFPVPEPAEGHA